MLRSLTIAWLPGAPNLACKLVTCRRMTWTYTWGGYNGVCEWIYLQGFKINFTWLDICFNRVREKEIFKGWCFVDFYQVCWKRFDASSGLHPHNLAHCIQRSRGRWRAGDKGRDRVLQFEQLIYNNLKGEDPTIDDSTTLETGTTIAIGALLSIT